MTQAYFNPAREEEFGALPDCEVFYADDLVNEDGETLPAGWYWWPCFPGCLPDSDPTGPFDTEGEALADARDVCYE